MNPPNQPPHFPASAAGLNNVWPIYQDPLMSWWFNHMMRQNIEVLVNLQGAGAQHGFAGAGGAQPGRLNIASFGPQLVPPQIGAPGAAAPPLPGLQFLNLGLGLPLGAPQLGAPSLQGLGLGGGVLAGQPHPAWHGAHGVPAPLVHGVQLQPTASHTLVPPMPQAAPGGQAPIAQPGTPATPRDTDSVVLLCDVCRDQGAGSHYGASVCARCSSFFLRASKNANRRCRRNRRACESNSNYSCTACRYERCLAAGMRKRPRIVKVEPKDDA